MSNVQLMLDELRDAALRLRGAELEAWIAERYPRPIITTNTETP